MTQTHHVYPPPCSLLIPFDSHQTSPYVALEPVAHHQNLVTAQGSFPSQPFSNLGGGMSAEPDSSSHITPGPTCRNPRIRRHPNPASSVSQGNVIYTHRTPFDRRSCTAGPLGFPLPQIRSRQRRPQSIHIVTYPSGYIPRELRPPSPPLIGQEKRRRRKRHTFHGQKASEAYTERRLFPTISANTIRVIEKVFACLRLQSKPALSKDNQEPLSSARPRYNSTNSTSRISEDHSLLANTSAMVRVPGMAESFRPPSAATATPYRNSIMSVRSAKNIMHSSVMEIDKPVASGSGVSCSILLAEPNIFLSGFDHNGHESRGSRNSTALLRGKLQLSVSKNVKIKAITLKLVGKARTEWPEGIPPLKVDLFEEETLRTQSLVFFHAMHEGMWGTEYGNQCTFRLKGDSSTGSQLIHSISPNISVSSFNGSSRRQPSNLSAKELRRLSLHSVNSRSFGKGDNPVASAVQAKGYKIFHPGTYDYSFELPIDHHQLETTKLHYGHVKWELEAVVERAGAFKPNLHGTKEVSVVRIPDQLSLEMSEPISISRKWEDQLHYDIMISGKSFPIGAKIPIAFKLTPLAKVQVHKLKVFVTESNEYWTNDRRVTRKDPGRKILLVEKAAGKPLDSRYERSEVRFVSGGELSPAAQEEARRCAERMRLHDANRRRTVPEPLPEPTENILGALDLGLENYWGSTEIEMNVQLPTCNMMAKDKLLKLHPDCSWKNVNVYHWIKIVMRISRADPEDPTGKRRRHFEISIDSPFTVLNCRATQANTALPEYCGRDSPLNGQHQTTCGCPDARPITRDSPSSSTGTLPLVTSSQESLGGNDRFGVNRVNLSALPMPPQPAHLQAAQRTLSTTSHQVTSASPLQRVRNQEDVGMRPADSVVQHRPMELIRCPSYNPPAFDADEPPPPALDAVTPPPNYDIIVGTPSVDGMADYFARLADYDDPDSANDVHPAVHGHANGLGLMDGAADIGETHESVDDGAETETEESGGYMAQGRSTPISDDSDTDSGDEHPARIQHGGRVNIANPRTPGGRLVPSRSFELERPVMRLDMAGVVRRGEQS